MRAFSNFFLLWWLYLFCVGLGYIKVLHAFCLQMLFKLNCRMYRYFVLFVDILPCVVCGLLFVVVFSGVLVCGV